MICRGSNDSIAKFASNAPERVRVIPDAKSELTRAMRVATVPWSALITVDGRVLTKGMPVTEAEFEALLQEKIDLEPEILVEKLVSPSDAGSNGMSAAARSGT
jgi:hypothetical protein